MSDAKQSGAARDFLRELAARRRGYQAALYACGLMRWLGWAALALLGLAVADYFLAFDPQPLARLGTGVAMALGVALLVLLVRAAGFRASSLATELDERRRDARQQIRSAFELANGRETEAEISAWLTDNAIRGAHETLAATPQRDTLPVEQMKRRGLAALAQIAIAACVLGLAWNISTIVLARIFHPFADIPPYSLFTFDVSPAKPEVVYGDTAELGVDVGGAPLRGPVWLVTRDGDDVQRATCFQEQGRRFTQRIEKVARPVEFCFATGRARSRWHRVEVKLEPRISVARLTVAPPAYSLKPSRSFIAGEAGLQELRSARARLDITSNRPLAGGEMRVNPKGGAAPEIIAGHKTGLHVMRFEWAMQSDAEIEATVTDVLGTTAREPYKLKQKLLPDLPPTAVVTEPGGFAMATPKATLRLAGYAEDDLGLRRVDLIRALAGYRDRIHPLGPAVIAPRQNFADDIDLGRLGVVPGDVLEFYLEAEDTNPDETGRASSPVARVQIIAEEEYAEMLQQRTDAEQFLARYQAAEQALQEVQKAMEELQKKLDANAPASEIEKAKQDLQDATNRAQELFQKLAEDLPVYQLDRESQEAFRDTAKALTDAKGALAQAGVSQKELGDALKQMQEKLSKPAEQVKKQAKQAKNAAEIARVMEMSGRYLQLVAEQAELDRQFARFNDPSRIDDATFFRNVERRQQEIRKVLEEFRDELVKRAKALPEDEDVQSMHDEAIEFASKIGALNIPPVMSAAEKSAKEQNGRSAKENVALALERMKKLVGQCNGMGNCSGTKPHFNVSQCMRQTLQQLQRGMGRGLSGRGSAEGSGAGGDDDGFSMGAATPLNVPMYGPARTLSGVRAQMPEGGQRGDGRGRPVAGGTARGSRSGAHDADTTEPGGTPRIDDAPEKYREAVKRYFNMRETKP